MTKRYVTLTFIVEGPNVPVRPPSLNELVYRGLYAIDRQAEASDVSLAWESEAKHEHFDEAQKKHEGK